MGLRSGNPGALAGFVLMDSLIPGSQLPNPDSRSFVKVAALAEVPPGTVKQIAIGERTIALCNVEGIFYALDNVCIHRGGPLGQGYLDGEKLECPWHGWQFNVKTGGLVMNPRECVSTYKVKIEGPNVLVAL